MAYTVSPLNLNFSTWTYPFVFGFFLFFFVFITYHLSVMIVRLLKAWPDALNRLLFAQNVVCYHHTPVAIAAVKFDGATLLSSRLQERQNLSQHNWHIMLVLVLVSFLWLAWKDKPMDCLSLDSRLWAVVTFAVALSLQLSQKHSCREEHLWKMRDWERGWRDRYVYCKTITQNP